MENNQFEALPQASEALISDSSWCLNPDNFSIGVNPHPAGDKGSAQAEDSIMSDCEELQGDSMVCNSGRLVRGGISAPSPSEEIILFLNAGDDAAREVDSGMKLAADTFYDGGNILRTNESICDAGDYPFVYQTARLGKCSYLLNNLSPGDYFVDLHFAEIINTNGPRGMRLFNVFIQDEKVLYEFDIYALVGANKPVQLVDCRVTVKEDGVMMMRFEEVLGSPLVSAICIRRAPELLKSQPKNGLLRCHSCTAEIEVPLALARDTQQKMTSKYERAIEDLTIQVQRKKEECSEAWMSLAAAQKQLEDIRSELDNKGFHTFSLDQRLEKQTEELKAISTKYEKDKKFWMASILDLEKKIKMMKLEHQKLSREAHGCADSIPELSEMIFAVQALVSECKDLKTKYLEEQKMRKRFFNEIQEVKGNIRVFCRCRPLTKQEQATGCATIADFEGARDGDLTLLTAGSSKKTYKFDRVYTPKDGQVDVFADASPMVISVLDGYNVCIFAYGQTGTGKTFTMEGTEHNRGVNYRTLDTLFKVVEERSDTFSYEIYVSVLEIYNEQIRDLLSTSAPTKRLEIKQGPEGSHHVPGLIEAKVENTKRVWEILQAGSNARAVGSNNVNEHSSRSHCMLCVSVRAKNLLNGESTKSKLWLVDLAGSERLAKTDVQGERLKEAQNINKSLSALGDVISALANKSNHIPYRNSKLTHLLQDSLGGDSKTLMFVQISPADKDLGETVSSLNFASRVRGVELAPAKRQVDTGELQKTKTLLDKARMEVRSKDDSIRKLEETLQNVENKARGRDQTYKMQQEKIRELEGELGVKEAAHSQTARQILHLQEMLKVKEEACNNLQYKVELQKVRVSHGLSSASLEPGVSSATTSLSLKTGVKEMEIKLKEREGSDSAAFEQVKILEKKLKEQIEESKSHSFALQDKIHELEEKLKQQERSEEVSKLHEKIRELELKLREQAQPQEKPEATPAPLSMKVITPEMEAYVLKSSTSSNRAVECPAQGKAKADPPNDVVRRKRGSKEFRSSDSENNMPTSTSTQHDKRIRKSDPPKPFTRLSRATKPAGPTTQRPFSLGRATRDQAQGGRDRDSKRRWC